MNGHFNPATLCHVPKKTVVARISVIPNVVSPALFIAGTCAFNLSQLPPEVCCCHIKPKRADVVITMIINIIIDVYKLKPV